MSHSVISSRASVGLRAKRWKLFLIPEEYSPPQVLVDTDNYLEMNRNRTLDDGFIAAFFCFCGVFELFANGDAYAVAD